MEKTIDFKKKPEFVERIKSLIPDYEEFFKCFQRRQKVFIRVNTLKISKQELIEKLNKKWDILDIKGTPAIEVISNLKAGELGSSLEHQLGYFYVQDLSSMMPIIALNPKKDDSFLDLCASPGSKTTQAAMLMENQGVIIANDQNFERIKTLNANIQRMGVTNTIITRMDSVQLCKSLEQLKISFNKILVDPSCSGEGTIRNDFSTFEIWDIKRIKSLASQQKAILGNALRVLSKNGEIVYSTCTLSPEENEEVIEYITKKFNTELVSFNLPIKSRPGIKEWEGYKFDFDVSKVHRIYPQDNDSEGFFIAKLRWSK